MTGVLFARFPFIYYFLHVLHRKDSSFVYQKMSFLSSEQIVVCPGSDELKHQFVGIDLVNEQPVYMFFFKSDTLSKGP